jgi:hypothetical protein
MHSLSPAGPDQHTYPHTAYQRLSAHVGSLARLSRVPAYPLVHTRTHAQSVSASRLTYLVDHPHAQTNREATRCFVYLGTHLHTGLPIRAYTFARASPSSVCTPFAFHPIYAHSLSPARHFAIRVSRIGDTLSMTYSFFYCQPPCHVDVSATYFHPVQT